MDVKSAAIQVLQQAGTALQAKDIAEKIMVFAERLRWGVATAVFSWLRAAKL